MSMNTSVKQTINDLQEEPDAKKRAALVLNNITKMIKAAGPSPQKLGKLMDDLTYGETELVDALVGKEEKEDSKADAKKPAEGEHEDEHSQ
jgi:hypothetical protein